MSQNKEPSKTLIYVSNLPFDTTDEQFKDLFKGFNVKTAYVAKRKNGKSKGFGFVNLEKESEQNAAIEKLNGKELNSRKLIARIAYNDERRTENGELKEEFKTQTNNTNPPSETVVHVSNLAWTTNDEELRKIFAEFNPKSATVAMRKNGRSKGFGFVEFNNKEDREKALSLDQKTFSERQITVKQSTGYRGDKPRDSNRDNNRRNNRDNRDNRDNNRRRNNNSSRRSKSPTKRSPSGNSSNNNNNNSRPERKASEFTIYIKNLPFELDETDLKDVFQEFRPTAANIPKRGGRSKGFGFVEFGNSKDQNDALRNLDQSEINGRVVSISISKGGSSSRDNNRDNNNRRSPRRNRSSTRNNNRDNNNNRSDRRGSKTRSRGEKKSNATSELSKTNAYVSNIPFSINEKKLEEFFKDLKVNKCTIPRKRNGDSFGYAFVEFASIEDQQKALKLNDSVVEGRKIVIQAAFHRTDSN